MAPGSCAESESGLFWLFWCCFLPSPLLLGFIHQCIWELNACWLPCGQVFQMGCLFISTLDLAKDPALSWELKLPFLHIFSQVALCCPLLVSSYQTWLAFCIPGWKWNMRAVLSTLYIVFIAKKNRNQIPLFQPIPYVLIYFLRAGWWAMKECIWLSLFSSISARIFEINISI